LAALSVIVVFRNHCEIPQRNAAIGNDRIEQNLRNIKYLRAWRAGCSTIEQMQWSGAGMLRISENTENGKVVRLRLDGRVTAESYAELEAACSRHRETPSKIILVDMGGVVFMDNEVASELARLRSEQLRIINCSPFIETLLSTAEAYEVK
jgi:anti-anti-sigma regulatory factor